MTTKREFTAAVTKHLRTIAPMLDSELAAMAESLSTDPARILLVEYDASEFSRSFAVSVWPMDRNGKPTTTGIQLLDGKAVAVPSEFYDDDRYEDIDPWYTAGELFERWFVARWKKVRSTLGPRVAVIGHHDSYFKTDLATGNRINWDEVLKAARAKPAAYRRPLTPPDPAPATGSG